MQKSAIVIGAGIVGLATARALAERGFSVQVFERNEKAVGASIRNFGMVWPVGQPLGKLYERAMRSQSIWKTCCKEGSIWHEAVGSLLNVYEEDECRVVEEFYELNKAHRDISVLEPKRVLEISAATNPKNLKAALWSSTEVIVDPREAIAKLPEYLEAKYDIRFFFNKAITRVEHPSVFCGNQKYEADIIFVCSGADFETLYPELFLNSGITKCKLQMLRTVPQPDNWRIGPALSAGLTLTHYGAFDNCPSLSALKKRVEAEMPEYVQWGIHVMISQNGLSEITIGDSHEYGLVHDPFDRQSINHLILDYLKQFTIIKNPTIGQTWNGIYPKLKGKTEFVKSPTSGVHVINGLSGAGMTLSFGLAEEVVETVSR
ncbi:MAG: TIGR03364 family FAD-dependent oxidoreductase [Bacteroidetes bacterium]|nr:TIGR03364 family FAD-dependent oxidoreductase [Bacteroidota bacterium]